MICIYAVYKRPTSDKRYTKTESEGMEKKYFKKMHLKKKAGVAIFILGNIDFKAKAI